MVYARMLDEILFCCKLLLTIYMSVFWSSRACLFIVKIFYRVENKAIDSVKIK